MKINFNQLDRGYYKFEDEYDLAVMDVLKSGWYILGKEVESFENNFKKYIGANYCVGLNSGLDSLILAFRSLDICLGDEVIVPANTYIASILGITENGAIPVLVEPDEYYNIDADKIEKKITPRTKAILVVHLYGQTANMERIKDISNRYGLYLIEDCAQSHGSKFNNKTSGTFGDIGCFSFYPTKNIGAFGDAGCIVTNNEKIFEKVKMLRNYGSKVKYQNEILGVNSRLDEIQAAILNVKLKYYPDLLLQRKTIVNYYLNNIKNKYIDLPSVRENSTSVFHLFVIQVENRDLFQKFLMSFDINTQIHYPIPPHLSKAYDYLGFKDGDFPITESYARRVLSLPLYDGMTLEEAKYVVKAINEYQEDE